ncbi:hypothetical protein K438DRAFT_1764633 [Mycena galopus ATCC 62051]|nr:hypothetical protein K438DRAFT_1764633 [Mycena galopus ATCC 62051]
MSAPDNRIVKSPKNVFYLRPNVGSRWLGPTDDRVWVPALDWPEGLDPPADPEATPVTTVGAHTPRAPDMIMMGGQPVPQYATVTSRDPLVYQGPQHRAYDEFSRVTGPPLPLQGRPPPTRSLELDPRARAHRAYTGPFTNTVRQRDLGIARRQEEERRRNDKGHRHRDETTACRYEGSRYLGDPSDPHRDVIPRTTPGGPDRTREHHLREWALHSHAPPGAKAKILPTRPVKERLRREGEARTETSRTSTTESSLDYDDTMPPAVAPNPMPAEPIVQSYSGSLPTPPPNPDAMTAHWLGPQMSLHDAMAHAATERPSEWVRGMRTTAGEWPTEHTPVGTYPLASDLRAARLLHFLAPINRDATHRVAWMESVLRGFLVWGLFERHVQLGAWIHMAHKLEHYPFDATNITYSQFMQWVHAHGVDRRSVAAQELHAFATSWRNSREGLPTTTGEHFSGHDIENQESVLCWDIGRISSWAMLWHGPVRSGVTSLTDRCPADGVRREQQQAQRGGTAEDADMTDVEPGQGAPQTAPQPAPEDGELLGDGAPAAPSGGDTTASSNGA